MSLLILLIVRFFINSLLIPGKVGPQRFSVSRKHLDGVGFHLGSSSQMKQLQCLLANSVKKYIYLNNPILAL